MHAAHVHHVGLRALSLGLVALAQVALTGAVSAQQANEPELVLESFERALNAYNEDAVVGLFTADGTLRNNYGDGEVISQAQLRIWVRAAGERNLHAHLGSYTASEGKTQFTMEVGPGEWHREGAAPMRARGTAEVRGGRIALLVLEPIDSRTDGAPIARQQGPSSSQIGLIALGVGSLVALVAGPGRVWPRQQPVRPNAGALHAALGAWAGARRHSGA
jgi:hypothetical protein